jgi:hypothetical protein
MSLLPPRPTIKPGCEHNRFVCGLTDPLTGGPSCPACAAEQEADSPTQDDSEWRLKLSLGLPRQPQPIDQQKQRALLMQLADLEKTCRKRPEFGAAVRGLLAAIVCGGEQ